MYLTPLSIKPTQKEITSSQFLVGWIFLRADSSLSPTCHDPMPWLFLKRSPPWLFTNAALGGLKPAPASRFRGAYPHLLCSYAHFMKKCARGALYWEYHGNRACKTTLMPCNYLFLNEIEIRQRGISKIMLIEFLRQFAIKSFLCITNCCDIFNIRWKEMMWYPIQSSDLAQLVLYWDYLTKIGLIKTCAFLPVFRL